MKDRLHEIKHEIYELSLIIENAKDKIKELHSEANQINGYKKIERDNQKIKNLERRK